MADRVFPAGPPAANGNGPAANGNGAAAPPFPATKAQLYQPNPRPAAYRPQPTRRRRHHSRSCCCRCCLWTAVAFLVVLFLIISAGAVFYLIFRPHRPSFSVTSFRLAYLNTTASAVSSSFNLTVSAWNPNKKLIYIYGPTSVSVLAGDVAVGDGNFPTFVHGKRNTTVLQSTIKSNNQPLDAGSLGKLKSALNDKSGVALKVKLDTKVKLKAGGLKTPRIRIRVICDGIRASVPAAGKSPAVASTANVNCKVDTRIKIWKWTF